MTPIPELRQQLEPAVVGGLLDPDDADEVAESLFFVGVLCERGVITRRLADHLVEMLAIKKADQMRAQRLAQKAGEPWTTVTAH